MSKKQHYDIERVDKLLNVRAPANYLVENLKMEV